MDRVSDRRHRSAARARLAAVYGVLALITAGGWLALLGAAHRYPLLLALGVTAYVLGLRHAVDPDHIAAIDATTRKLMHRGERPVAVGFFFSLGHSTIVFLLTLLVAAFGFALKPHLHALQSAGAIVGTSVSALFLFGIAAANAAVLLEVLRGRNGGQCDFQAPGGWLTRILRPALALVTKSMHMYPLGMLFGLGFDTASEIALLGISAASAAGGMPVTYILLLPLLFAAGMSLADTTEGVAMLGAYGWAYVRPRQKLFYNVNMTLLSVVISLVIGSVEAFAVIGTQMGDVRLSQLTAWLSFSTLGVGIVVLFGANLAFSAALCRLRSRPS
ncbi:MAG: HoxN/HupN/NixA family nickel/cobalt transporter [Candidatus Baltobacteraceae bacterium]